MDTMINAAANVFDPSGVIYPFSFSKLLSLLSLCVVLVLPLQSDKNMSW